MSISVIFAIVAVVLIIVAAVWSVSARRDSRRARAQFSSRRH